MRFTLALTTLVAVAMAAPLNSIVARKDELNAAIAALAKENPSDADAAKSLLNRDLQLTQDEEEEEIFKRSIATPQAEDEEDEDEEDEEVTKRDIATQAADEEDEDEEEDEVAKRDIAPQEADEEEEDEEDEEVTKRDIATQAADEEEEEDEDEE